MTAHLPNLTVLVNYNTRTSELGEVNKPGVFTLNSTCATRNAEKLAKVAKALGKGLSVAEIVTLTAISRASVKRYRQESAAG